MAAQLKNNIITKDSTELDFKHRLLSIRISLDCKLTGCGLGSFSSNDDATSAVTDGVCELLSGMLTLPAR